MTDVGKTFADAVNARLEELGRNAFAVEKAGGLPVDAIRSVIRDDEKRAVPRISRAKEICDLLGLEFYIGPPREITPAPEVDLDGSRFATVARHDTSASAGGGFVNFDEAPIDHLAFSKTWLMQNGIQPGASVLINARGQSMEPSIYDGDLVMIDRRKREVRNGRIYVYNDPAYGTRVKRLEVFPGHAIIVRSDNPDQKEFPPEYHTGDAMNAISDGIIGEVVWSGHKWT